MLYFVIGILGLIILFIAIISFLDEDIDVVEDYEKIKQAYKEYMKINSNRCTNIKDLSEYIEGEEEVNWDRYSISSDERSLIVKNASNKIEDEVKEANINVKRKGNNIYLSFYNLKISTIVPKASINMMPNDNITTTTTIRWSYKDSVVERNEIKDVEWRGKKSRYSEPGEYKVELRVQDMNGNWSNWVQKKVNVIEIEGVSGIAAGYDNLFIINKNGKAFGYGKNKHGQMGTGNNEDLKYKQRASRIENAKQIVSGEEHTLVLMHDGKVMSIGRNNCGQLGKGDTVNSSDLVEVWGMEKVRYVDVGKDFSGAVLASGEVMTWGNNEFCQLGQDDVKYKSVPDKINDLKNVKQISFGYNHGLALLFDGTVVGWGDNKYGQIGNGFTGKKVEPTVIDLSGVKYICAGKNISLAILENGKVYGWGDNSKYQVGIDEKSVVVKPTMIEALKDIKKIDSKSSFVVAITSSGDVYTWGKYIDGEKTHKTPIKVKGIKYAKDIAASYYSAFVLTKDERVICWSKDVDEEDRLYIDDIEPVEEETIKLNAS